MQGVSIRLLLVKFIRIPIRGVLDDVIGNALVRRIIPDDVVMKPRLPGKIGCCMMIHFPYLGGHGGFDAPNDGCQILGLWAELVESG